MPEPTDPTRRSVIQTGLALGVTGLGAVGTAAAGRSDERGSSPKRFGRIYANGELWRTNVVKPADEEYDPDDDLFFVHGGDPDEGGDGKLQPAVSESAPGDQDYNGGKWTHFGTEVVDQSTYETEYKPLTSEAEVRAAEGDGVVEIAKGKPYDSAPPNYFLCPLNGRA